MSDALRAQAEALYPQITSSGAKDCKAWARRFIWRAERGDKDLLMVQIHYAYMAMDLPVPKGSAS